MEMERIIFSNLREIAKIIAAGDPVYIDTHRLPKTTNDVKLWLKRLS